MHDEAPETDRANLEGRGVNKSIVWTEDPLITVQLSDLHRVQDFKCPQSARVEGFFTNERKILVPLYCRAFIAPNPDDALDIWGYYTLSAAVVVKDNLTGSDEKRISQQFRGYPAPMVRIGFMGKSQDAPKGFGVALLIDAARRVYRNADIAAWGLILEPEGGSENKMLYSWYEKNGFKACRKLENTMYAPLSSLIPNLI
jgi:hypothetical protein